MTIRITLFLFMVSFSGENSYGINIHSLEHLAEYVELHGPLPLSSLFHFESFNGFIVRQCHGTTLVARTVELRLLTHQSLRRNIAAVKEPEEKKLIDKLQNKR